jgi:hypothetical protein
MLTEKPREVDRSRQVGRRWGGRCGWPVSSKVIFPESTSCSSFASGTGLGLKKKKGKAGAEARACLLISLGKNAPRGQGESQPAMCIWEQSYERPGDITPRRSLLRL